MYTVSPAKQELSETLAADQLRFLASGGKVYECALNESALSDWRGYNNEPIGAVLPGKKLISDIKTT